MMQIFDKRVLRGLGGAVLLLLLWFMGRGLLAPAAETPPAPTESLPTATLAPTDAPVQEATEMPTEVPTFMPTATADNGYQQAAQFAGRWEGEWVNTTFGSSGPISAEVAVNPDGTLTFTLDVDGYVFGLYDPDPVSYTGHFDLHQAEVVIADDPVWGNATITFMEGGVFHFAAALIPDVEIASMTIDGSFAPGTSEGGYLITFVGGDMAEGTITLTKVE